MKIKQSRLLFYPFSYGLVIPILVGYFQLSFDKDTAYVMMAIGFIFVALHLVDFFRIFILRKGDDYTARNAIFSKEELKIGIIIAIALVIIFVTLTSFQYNELLIDPEKYETDEPKRRLSVFNSIFMYSAIFLSMPLIFGLFDSKYNYGQSLVYLKTSNITKNRLKRIDYYHKAVNFYNKFVSDNFNMRMKHENQILSLIMMETESEVDNKMKEFLNQFNDDYLQPARFLSKLISKPYLDMLEKIPRHENIDLWFRRLASIATILAVVIAILFQIFIQPK